MNFFKRFTPKFLVTTVSGDVPLEQIKPRHTLLSYKKNGERTLTKKKSTRGKTKKWTLQKNKAKGKNNNIERYSAHEGLYVINRQHFLFGYQSIVANDRVIHVKDLKVGDELVGKNGETIIVWSVNKSLGITRLNKYGIFLNFYPFRITLWEKVRPIRIHVSGDHTYLLNGLLVHNANRYWVAGGSSTNWTATGNTNWGTASNTQDNASVPTSADDVFFDGVGTGASNVTIDNGATCLSFDFTGYTNTATHSGGATWNIYGSGVFSAGMTLNVNAFTSITNFCGTSAYTLTCNGKEPSQVRINGSGLKITLQDALTVSAPTSFGNLTITQGELDTNTQTVTTGIFTTAANALTKVVTITNSTINCQSSGNTFSFTLFGSNLTVNSTGATLNISGNQTSAGPGNNTYAAINISNQTTNQMTVSGAFTVDTLSISSGAGVPARVSFVNNFTINSGGTFTVAGNSAKNRILVKSSVEGTARTITNTGVTQTWSNCDFQDITLGTSYNASAITGGCGDAGGNTNITFTTPTTWYMKATTNNGTANNYDWSENDNWYTATNGGGSQMGAGLSPLAQDTLQIDTNSFTTTSTVRTDMYLIGKDISFSGNTDTLTLTDSTAKIIMGSLDLTGVTTNNWNDTTRFMARSNSTLTCAGVSWIDNITFATPTATMTLADALTTTSAINLSIGTFDSAGYTMTSSTLNISGGTQNPGSSTWVMTTSSASTFVRTGGTFNAGTSVLKATGTTGETVFNDTVASPTYYGVWLARGTNASDVGFRRGFTASYIQDTGTVAHTIRFKFGSTYTFTGANPFQVSGSAGQLISIDSCTDSSTLDPSTSTHTLSATNVSPIINQDYLNIQHSIATQASTWYAGANSTDNQAVATAGSGWIFTARPSGGVKDIIGMGIIPFSR